MVAPASRAAKASVALVAALCGSGAATASELYLPDPERTPGEIYREVRQHNLEQTVCMPGYSAMIRPNPNYTSALRKKFFKELNLPGDLKEYRLDHLVPLCAGGHPYDQKNLWMQPVEAEWPDKAKNELEGSVCRALCKGDITLYEAQVLFMAPADWTKSYEVFFGFDPEDEGGEGTDRHDQRR